MDQIARQRAAEVANSDDCCRHTLVTDYLENALSQAERARFEEHLIACPGCQTYFEQMRQTIDVLGRVTEESLEPAARDQLLDLFRNWKRGDRAN